MSRGDEIFERNLEQLLVRAYTAVSPGDEYLARIEAAVLAAMDAKDQARQSASRLSPAPAPSQPHSPPPQRPARRPLVLPGLRPLLAAAALLLAVSAVWWLARAPSPSGLERLLADGHVAWRATSADDWAALPDGARTLPDAARRELATPALRGFDVDLAPDGGLSLRPSSQASLLREPGAALRIELSRGGVDVRRDSDAGAGGAEWLVAVGDRVVHLETGALSAAWSDEGAGGVSVLLWSGRAWLETPAGRQTLSPGQAVADGAPAGLPRWDGRLPAAEPLVPGQPAGADREPTTVPAEATPEPDAPAAPRTLCGRVLDRSTALPLGAYTLTLVLEDVTSKGPTDEARAIAAQDGRFEWKDIEAGTYALFAQAPGYAAASRRGLAIDGATPPPTVELALEPGGARVSGRVVAATTGAPVSGAVVLSESDAPVHMLAFDAAEIPPSITARTTTGEDGRFELTGLASGPQVLRATAAGFAPQWITVDATAAPTASATSATGESSASPASGAAQAVPASAEPDHELRLPEAAAVQGRVTLDNGAPAAGMFVLVSLGEQWPQRACLGMGYGVTDAEGRYRIGDLPAEEAVVLMLGSMEQLDTQPAPPRVLPVLLQAGQTATVDFLGEPRAGRLHGRIVDAAGQPANGLMLSLVAADSTAAQAQTDWLGAMTDAEGGYQFMNLRPGRYELYLVEGAGVSVVRAGAVEFLGGGDQQQDLQLPGATISGTLRDGVSGEPLPNGLLLVTADTGFGAGASANVSDAVAEFEARVQLGADGHFSCGPFPAGHYRLQAHAASEGWGEALAEVDLPAARADVPVDLVAYPGGSLSVLALDDDGVPLAGALIELLHPAGRRIDVAASQLTAGDGAFDVGGVSAGWWTVRVSLAGRVPAEQRVEVRVGETAHARVTLPPAR